MTTSAEIDQPTQGAPADRLGRRRVAGWEDVLHVRLDRIGVELQEATAYIAEMTRPDESPIQYREIKRDAYAKLIKARQALAGYSAQPWMRRFLSRAALYEYIDMTAGEMSETLLLILPPALVRARIPYLRADLKRYIPSADPRYDIYTRLLDSLVQSTAGNNHLANANEGNVSAGQQTQPPEPSQPGRPTSDPDT
jgi:hypothetical protein